MIPLDSFTQQLTGQAMERDSGWQMDGPLRTGVCNTDWATFKILDLRSALVIMNTTAKYNIFLNNLISFKCYS